MTRWSSPRTGRVWLDSWAGRTSILVQVLGETPKRYRVAWLESRLGRVAGGQALVPKDAVTIPGLREGDAALAALARVKGGER